MLAALLAAAALCSLADRLSATMITFTGVVDEVVAEFTPVPFAVGDAFSATFTFNYHPDTFGGGGGRVLAYVFTVGDFTLSGRIEHGFEHGFGSVDFDTDPANGAILWQLFQFNVVHPPFFVVSEIVLYAPAPTGVVPPLEQFNENVFYVQLVGPGGEQPQDTATGHLTSFPTITALPDTGTADVLLSCSLLVIVALRLSLRRIGTQT
jgi:hypothetical protein